MAKGEDSVLNTKKDCADQTAPRLKRAWRATPVGIPAARYIDKDFAKLEADALWPHVWQNACRLEEIPSPGSYVVYEILDQSILIVRQPDDSVKAFYNVCPHRATALGSGSGRFQLGQITCPFHGWKWDLAGENVFVLEPDRFLGGCLDPTSLHLKECQVATFLNCVWINMDPECIAFDEWIGPIKAVAEATRVQDMYLHWHKSFILEANWKVAQEAFFEGYHVPQTHPQLLKRSTIQSSESQDADTANPLSEYDFSIKQFPQGHSYGGSDSGGPFGLGRFSGKAWNALGHKEQALKLIHYHEHFSTDLQSMVLDEDVNVARSMLHRPFPEESDMDEEFQRTIREHYAHQGRIIGSADALSRMPHCNIFPNYTFLPLYGNVLIYRVRPTKDNNPDRCRFEVWSCRTYPETVRPPKPAVEDIADPMNPGAMCMFLRQDFANIPRQQIGIHSRGIEHTLLHDTQESMIAAHHFGLDMILDRYMSRSE